MGCVRTLVGGNYLLSPVICPPIEHPYRGLLRHPSHGLVACDVRAEMGVEVAARLVPVAGIRCTDH